MFHIGTHHSPRRNVRQNANANPIQDNSNLRTTKHTKYKKFRNSKMTQSKLSNPSLPFVSFVSFVYFVDKNHHPRQPWN
jgi:hypothetical protein